MVCFSWQDGRERDEGVKTAARALKVVGKKRGVVTRGDLFAAGLTRHQVDGAVDAGLLTVIWRGVYLLAGVPLKWEHKLEAALRLTEPDGAVAGLTAAALLHIEDFSRGPLQIVIPEKRQFHLEGVKVLRSRDFDPVRDVWKVDGFRVTKVPRTLLDLAAQCSEQQLVFAIEGMLRKRRFLLVDFLFKDARVAVQVDGEKTHLTPGGVKKDQVQDANLKAARYFPFRTWPTELTHDPEAFLSRLEGVLASQPAAPVVHEQFPEGSLRR